MEKNCGILVAKKLYFVNFLTPIGLVLYIFLAYGWTWIEY